MLINVFRIIRKSQLGKFDQAKLWNAGKWISRARFEYPWFNFYIHSKQLKHCCVALKRILWFPLTFKMPLCHNGARDHCMPFHVCVCGGLHLNTSGAWGKSSFLWLDAVWQVKLKSWFSITPARVKSLAQKLSGVANYQIKVFLIRCHALLNENHKISHGGHIYFNIRLSPQYNGTDFVFLKQVWFSSKLWNLLNSAFAEPPWVLKSMNI